MGTAKFWAACLVGIAVFCGFSFFPGEGLPVGARAADESSGRVRAGLVALYDFQEDSGPIVKDRSGVGPAADLRIEDLKAVRRSQGSLEVRGKTLIRTDKPATKISEAVRRSGEMTLEAWITPAKTTLTGPARIVSLSKHTTERNFTLGQEGDNFDVRFRTTRTDLSGIPSASTDPKTLQTKRTHVVYTRDRAGRTRIYLDGQFRKEQSVPGEVSNWNTSFQLALANELTGDRPWEGTFHLVAVYSRSLSPQEVRQNFEAGPDFQGPPRELAQTSVRARSGLLALYDFQEDSGPMVKDRSGTGEPLDLKIENPNAIRRSAGRLEVRGKAVIRSEKPASKLADAVRRSKEITLEAWITPAKTNLTGPARILTLSRDPNQRNFTLGQEGDKFDVRFRTTKTGINGVPSLTADPKSLAARLTHVVYTRDRTGKARLYLDGKSRKEQTIAGDITNWNADFRLALANEVTGDRPWEGTFHLVAIYGRSLSPREVEQNFQAGPAGGPGGSALAQSTDAKDRFFALRVAPILANHCLECHDSVVKEGGLDLSRKSPAFAGGESGKAILPGQSAKSLLWQRVESDEMPADRTPLSADEKKILRQWLDEGAAWSVDVIDPAVYAHGSAAGGVILQRLTRAEYVETVKSAVGVDIAKEADDILPSDLRADGFSNTAYNLNVDLKHVEAYAQLAEIIVSRMDPVKFAARFNKRRDLEDDTFRDLVAKMGKWLFRGPLSDQEIATYRGIASTVAYSGGDYKEAVGLILEAMLQSPRFLYRIENQRGDGLPYPVDPYELASRMSYILWGGPPDEALFKAAESGEILNPDKAAGEVRRMLKDPRAVKRSRQFVSEWLNLGRLDNLNPDPKKYPDWNPKLAQDMKDETLAFFEEIVWKQNRPLSDLFNAEVTFISPELARHYGMPAQGKGTARYDLSSVPSRGGLLTQGSVLTVGGDEASMVTRGLFVMHHMLRGVVKDPPPCVDTTPVPTRPGLTQRGLAESRISNANCGGCHARFEPLAFGLEKFDGLGSHHEKDRHGNPLRDDGEILFPGTAKPIKYKSSAELMDLLAQSERVKETLTWKVAQFAVGRPLSAADAPILEKIHQRAQKEGGRYSDLMLAIILSDLVQKTRTEPVP